MSTWPCCARGVSLKVLQLLSMFFYLFNPLAMPVQLLHLRALILDIINSPMDVT